jgi:NRAMP (natural resistance-associated macrophage protein)-like metal ion transporter
VNDIQRRKRPVTVEQVVAQEPTRPMEALPKIRGLWEKVGPGFITGASDDDPSGIATYSVAGAQFGYSMLWLTILTYPCSVAIQEVCARIGLLTGHGLATTIRRHYGKWILAPLTLLLFAANTVNVGADLQAMAGTAQQLAPGIPYTAWAIFFAGLTLILLIALPYRTYCGFLKYAALTLFSYVFVAFLSHADWGEVLHGLLVPTISLSPVYIMGVVSVLGTTISPYMFFWQTNEEVEEEISKGLIRKDGPEVTHRSLLNLDPHIFKDMRIDVATGMFYSQFIMFFIITAAAAVIFKGGTVTDVANLTLTDLANVLKPLLGDTAFTLFSLGIIGTGMLAVPILAGSASYAVSELFGWEEGLNKKFHEAKGFYYVIILSTVIGVAMNKLGVSPVAALYYTAIINGVVAIPMILIIWRMGNDKRLLGSHTNGALSNIFIGITAAIMTAAAVAMFVIR